MLYRAFSFEGDYNGQTVLLVVDIQRALIEYEPYLKDEFIGNIKELLNASRENDIEVVYVRHCGDKGGPLEKGCDGWQIYSQIAPTDNEKIFDKNKPSSFMGTGLDDYLKSKDTKTINAGGYADRILHRCYV